MPEASRHVEENGTAREGSERERKGRMRVNNTMSHRPRPLVAQPLVLQYTVS